ncbi:hypothetical protein HDC35_003417 [Sphingopyxis sp. JAI128]|nr:hypothetical protein [Sphingopyxis sp. JAI128]
MPQPAIVHHRQHRGLDLALGDMARPDGVPFGSMVGKISRGSGGALSPDRGQPPRVIRNDAGFPRRKRPFFGLPDNFGDRPAGRDPQENPATFAPALDNSGLNQNANMARNARLTLIEHYRQFADRQLHFAQKRHDSQSRRVRQGSENVDQLAHRVTYKAFFISGQPSGAAQFSAAREPAWKESEQNARAVGKKGVAPHLPRG